MHGAPLVVTDDPFVLAEVQRVAAAAGVAARQTVAPGSAGAWLHAPLVLLDAAQLPTAAVSALPRREGVVVLAQQDLDTDQWETCVTLGVGRVIRLPSADGELMRLLVDAVEPAATRSGTSRVIAVLGACGGAGATVFASALALTAARSGRAVLLLDADPHGPGIDVALGLETTDGARWGDIAAPSGRFTAEALHRALPSITAGRGSLSVLCHPRPAGPESGPALLDAVLGAGRRAGDVAVVDLPRTASPTTDLAIGRSDLAVLVVPAQVRGCYGAAGIVPRLADLGARAGIVVRGPSPGGLGADDIAQALDTPLFAGMRPEPRLDRRLDAGGLTVLPRRGPLGRAAAAVLARAGVTT